MKLSEPREMKYLIHRLKAEAFNNHPYNCPEKPSDYKAYQKGFRACYDQLFHFLEGYNDYE